jgi:hypothetical protein
MVRSKGLSAFASTGRNVARTNNTFLDSAKQIRADVFFPNELAALVAGPSELGLISNHRRWMMY